MAQKVYVSAWEADSEVEDESTVHLEDFGDGVEFLLIPAEDAETIRFALRATIAALRGNAMPTIHEALKLLEVK